MGNSGVTDRSAEAKILEAARALFTAKGFAGTNMRDIADRAGVNKGLIHYYEWNKSKLFMAVFAEAFQDFARQANALFLSEQPLPEKIRAFVDRYIDFLMANPHLPGFILSELNAGPEAFMQSLMQRMELPDPVPFFRQIEKEAKAGHIKGVSPLHFFLNLLAMCVFPFAARPMVQTLFKVSAREYDALLRERKEVVVDASLAVLYPAGERQGPLA